MTTLPEIYTADLRDYIRVIRARKIQIGIVALGLMFVVLALAFRQTPIFEGRAKVLVKPIQSVSSAISIPINPNLDTERQLILSQAVAEKVRQENRVTTPVNTLISHVKVQVVTDTEVLIVAYDDPVPSTAAHLANAFAKAYVDYRGSQILGQFQNAADAVQHQIDATQITFQTLDRKLGQTTDKQTRSSLRAQQDALIAKLAVLNQRLLDLQSNSSAVGPAAEVVQEADVPRSPASPNKVRNGLLALFTGLVIGTAVAFLRERFDDRVKSRQEVERRLGAPVIAAVPRVAGWRRTDEAQLVMRTDPKSPVSEAYRTLGTNVQYMASRAPLKVLMVTSALGGDGKTTTCANLAVVLAQAGKRVVLVSADLRRPRLHHFFDLANEVGLSEALSGEPQLPRLVTDPGIKNLRLVNAGAIPQDPAALLGSARAGELMDALRGIADFVIVDTPPVLAVADASILAPLVDGTIFVLDALHSSRSAMSHARDQMENAGAHILGAVFNNFDPTTSASYPYYYYYHYYHHSGDEAEGANGNGSKLPIRWRHQRRGAPSPNGEAQPDLTRSPRNR